MDSLTQLWVWKGLRFVIGWGVTIGAGLFGLWYGRRLQAAGTTLADLSRRESISWKRLAGLSVLLGGTYLAARDWAGLETFLKPISRFRVQFAMITLRSLLVFLGTTQWVIGSEDRRLRRTLVLVAISCLVMTGVELLTLWPMVSMLGNPELDRHSGVVLQSTGYSCAPCSLATVARLYGRVIPERDSALAMEAGMNGTSCDEMAGGARVLGFPEARPVTTTLEALATADLPVLISVEFGGVRNLHAVALIGLSSTTVYLADPLIGLCSLPHDRFRARWDGEAVLLGRPTFAATAPVTLSGFSPAAFKALSLGLEPPRPPPGGK